MTISRRLNYLNETKQMIKQAIIDKGVEVTNTDSFRSYVDKISLIEVNDKPKENFDIYRAYDVDIDENRIASGFSQYSWIYGKTDKPNLNVINVITKLMLENINVLQSSLFATVYVKNGRFGMWENDTSSEKLGTVQINTNTWYWIQCVFNVDDKTYNQYVLEDNNQEYTLSTLPSLDSWLVNIENGNRSAPAMELISIGNNSVEWNEQYIRGAIDLKGTQITLLDGTVWTP